MSTSLKKQLAAIASTRTNELDLKSQKIAHSQSLLFDTTVAANQSFDLLYQICLEGFDQLCAVDSRFTRFGQTLFSPQSRIEDRAQMNAAQDNDLRSVIKNFLTLVGARLLLGPAVKAVEWLIRRFRIHEYDTLLTVMTFLPFHTSPIFTALLSILPKQLPPAIKFLHPYVNSLSNPPRSILVHTSIHYAGFRVLLNDYVLDAARNSHHHSKLLSFWASIMSQTVNGRLVSSKSGRQNMQQQREDDFLVQILPVLSDALSIRKAPELLLGAYMIIIVLVTKTELAENVLDGLLEAVVLSWTSETIDPGIGCAAAIAERKQDLRLPARAMRAALKFEGLGRRIVTVSRQQDMQALASALITSSISHDQKKGILSQNAVELTREVKSHSILSQQELIRLQPLLQSKSLGADQSDTIARILAPEVEQQELTVHEEEASTAENLHTAATAPFNAQRVPRFDVADLPRECTEMTLLSVQATPLYNRLSLAFKEASNLLSRRTEFATLPLWDSQSTAVPTLLLSFYARFWSSDAPCLVRKHAIHDTLKIIRALPSIKIASVLQLLIPYTMVVLRDEARSIRQSAADLVLALCRVDDSDARQVEYWPIYGPGAPAVPGSADTLLKFIKTNVQNSLEGCIADSANVRSMFQQAFAKHSITVDAPRKPLKSAQKVELLTIFSYHVRVTPSSGTKLSLLSICNAVDLINGQPRSMIMLDCLRQWATDGKRLYDPSSYDEMANAELDDRFTECVHPGDQAALQYLLSLIDDSQSTALSVGLLKAVFKRLVTIWPSIKPGMRRDLAFKFLEMASKHPRNTPQETVVNESMHFLRTVTLPVDLTTALLRHAKDKLIRNQDQDVSKRRKTNSGKTAPSISASSANAELSVLSLALELAEASKSYTDLDLFHALFDILRFLYGYRNRSLVDCDYAELLIISKLLAISKQFDSIKSQINLSIVSTDTVLECARRTTNIQTRNAAILLLASLARHVPDSVLRTMVPVFALMSSDTVQQSDELSAHVVDQTIQEVMPLLIGTLQRQQVGLIPAIVDIISGFVAAYDHIAPARRLSLFTLLAETIGAEESLYAISALLVDRFPHHGGVANFIARLIRRFSVLTGLTTLNRYFHLVVKCACPDGKADDFILALPANPEATSKRLHALLAVAPLLIRESIPAGPLAKGLRSDDLQVPLHQEYGSLVESILQISTQVADQTQLRQFCSRMLESALSMLPFSEFVRSVEPLIDASSPEMSRSILKAFEAQFRLNKKKKYVTVSTAALAMIPKLSAILMQASDKPLALNAVVCIDQICEKFGKLNIDATLGVAQTVASPQCLRSENPLLRGLSLHCLGSMVEILQDNFIPLLPSATQAAIDGLQQSIANQPRDVRLHNAAFAFIISVVDSLAYMITSDMLHEILKQSHQSASSKSNEDENSIRNQFLQSVASRCELPIVFEAARQSWLSAVRSGPRALGDDLSLVQIAITNQAKTDIGRQARGLLESFLTFFDLRRLIAAERLTNLYSEAQIQLHERATIDAFIALLLKVNDATFRPFFVRLVEWTSGLSKQDDEGKMLRQIALFNFLAVFSDRLKSLITPYFTHVLDAIASILAGVDSGSSSSSSSTATTTDTTLITTDKPQLPTRTQTTLLLSTLTALRSSLTHDTTFFYTAPTRFTTVLPSLLTPLPVFPLSPSSPTLTHTIPTLVSLTHLLTSPPNPQHLTTLTQSLIPFLKSSHRRHRLAGVMAMRALTREVGEDWLAAQLPGLLPVVGELVEDGDEEVEEETRGWVGEMEGVLGEGVGEMLS